MTSLYDLYRQHKDAAGAFTGGLPAQNTGGYLNMPETPIPAQQSALASLSPGQMGTPSPGAGYAQVGNRRVTLADIGGQNDPFRGGGSVSVADFGGQKTYSLNPDVQRVGMEMEQQRQADQSMRAGLPNGMTLQEFLQAPFSRGKDQGALMQLYQQMQGAAVQQGQLAHAMRQPEVDPIAMQDRKFLQQSMLEDARQQASDMRQMRYLDTLLERDKLRGAGGTVGNESNINALANAIAAGQLDPNAISKRGALQSLVFAKVREINPDFNFNEASANAAFAKNANVNRSVKVLDSIDPVLDELEKAHKELGFGRFQQLNRAKARILEETGDPRYTAFNNLRNNIILEMTQAMQGSSQMSDARVKMEVENLKNSQSPAQMRAAIENIKKVIGARRDAFSSAPFPRSGAGGQPSGGSSARGQRTVTNRGTFNGKRVVQYSDGSVEYEQ